MNSGDPEHGEKPKRKPIWPWLVLLVATLAVIFIYDRVTQAFEDIVRDGQDLIAFFKWLFSQLPD